MFWLNCRRVARSSSSSFFCFPLLFFRVPGGVRGAKCCLWGAGLCGKQSPAGCHAGSWGGAGAGGRGEAGLCQQFLLFSDLLRLKLIHSLASWGISFDVSFPFLPEAGFRPPPCFSYMISWITVNIDNITLGTQRGKLKTTWTPCIQVFLFFSRAFWNFHLYSSIAVPLHYSFNNMQL